jgi:hypothetical protein
MARKKKEKSDKRRREVCFGQDRKDGWEDIWFGSQAGFEDEKDR